MRCRCGEAIKTKWVNGDSCVIGVMVDGNVCVQWMMGDVVHGWCAVVVSGNQIHDRAPPPKERLPDASHTRHNPGGRWNRGREWRARSMWGQWDRSPPGQGRRDSRDVKGHWVDRCDVKGHWVDRCDVRWLWQFDGDVEWLWQIRRPPGRSRRDRRPLGRSRRDRRPPGRSRRDRRPPQRSRCPPGRSRDPWPRLGPRGNGDTRGRESTFGFRNRGREFKRPW